jgi:hypothetical protein
MPSGQITLTNVRKCNVPTESAGSGLLSGTMTQDCIGPENILPGDQGWELSNFTVAATPGWPTSAASTTPEIEGFASATSVNVGSPITFYVDVRNGHPEYKIQVYRMGWYGSGGTPMGGRKMRWYDSTDGSVTQKKLNSVKQPYIAPDSSGTVDCVTGATHWNSSYTLNIPKNWLSGVYLAKINTIPFSGTQYASYIIFTVREDSRSSDLYFQNSVTTWQAYNPWGGKSLYPYPAGAATVVSFDRPYAGATAAWSGIPGGASALKYGNGAGEFLTMINAEAYPGWEYNVLRWIEKVGLDVTYCTDIDTESVWPGGKTVKAFLSVGHDEYWSQNMRDNVTTKRNAGVNLAFMGANACFYKIGFIPLSNLRRFEKQGKWRASPGPHEASLIGIEYVSNSHDEPLTLTNPLLIANPPTGHWAFYNTFVDPGSSHTTVENLVGYEVDGCWSPTGTQCNSNAPDSPCPGTSPSPSGTVTLGKSEFQSCPSPNPTTFGHAYMTIYSVGSGTNVWATGSMFLNWALDDYGYKNVMPKGRLGEPVGTRVNTKVQQITWNVLRAFSRVTTQSPVP